jgi:hypothetical protein
MPSITAISPVAALRRLRKAAWWHAERDGLPDTISALVEPMGDLSRSWDRLWRVHEVYEQRRSPESARALASALSSFDLAARALWGPSGWEPQQASRPKH